MELLIVVACSMGILAACEGTVLSPEDAIVASMRSDLQRLVTAQQAFFSANNHYASGVVSDQNNCFQAEGCVSFVPSPGNVVIFDYLAFYGSSGWRATITNPALANNPKTCGVYVGDHSDAPDPVLTEGVPGCWANNPLLADTILASMKSDLLRLVPAQEAFWSDNQDYAGGITSGTQVNGIAGSGRVSFVPSGRNVLGALTYVDAAGWKAVMTNPAVTYDPRICGIFTGSTNNSMNPAVTQPGVPACW